MKNVILHIGLPKTGSTALQNHYFAKLNHPLICYNPPLIIEALKEALKLLDFGCLKKKDIALLKSMIRSQSNKISQANILISLETLSQRLMRFDPLKRADFLHSIFPSATVVLVLRYQPTLLRSLYQEHFSQNYILKPEQVFIPFANHIFKAKDHWRSKMQIDIKEWNYTEAITYFRHYYGEKVHVLFFENFVDNLLILGDTILKFTPLTIGNKLSNAYLPKENISYNLTTMHILFNIVKYKIALKANHGYDSLHMQNLMTQQQQARHIFDASSKKGFLDRITNKKHPPLSTYNRMDEWLIRLIKKYNKLQNTIMPIRYELPKIIGDYIGKESKRMNASLVHVINKDIIPPKYL